MDNFAALRGFDGRTELSTYLTVVLGKILEYEELSKKKDQFGLSEEETKRRKQLDFDLMVARQAFDKFLGDLMKELEKASDKGNAKVSQQVTCWIYRHFRSG